MARPKRNEQQMGLFEAAINDRRYGNGGRPMTAPTKNGGRQSAVPTKDGALWQVKKRGSVGVSSHAENCGYDEGTVRSLQERGWHMYRDGEKVW